MGSSSLVWEWHLHCPVIVSNCVFKTFLLDDHLTLTDDGTKNKLKSRYKNLDLETNITGGIVQEVRIPPALQAKTGEWIKDDDVCLYLVNQNWTINAPGNTTKPQLATINEKDPGILQLKLTEPVAIKDNLYIRDTLDGAAYLLSEAFLRGEPNFETGDVKAFPAIASQNIHHYNSEVNQWSHTYAFHCPEWPSAAMEWQQRERKYGWPSVEIMNQVKAEGCYIVPVSKTSWRYSFVQAERRLMNSLSAVQKHIFALLKIICFQKLGCPRVLEVHHLRATFLRICEEIRSDSWREDQTTTLLMYSFDRMLYLLIEGYFPDYFISNRNLLDGISEDFIDETQKTLAEARSEALKIFMQYSLSFQFESNQKIKEDVFKPIYAVMENKIMPQNAGECIIYILIPFLLSYTMGKVDKDTTLTKESASGAIRIFHQQVQKVLKENNLEIQDEIIWPAIIPQVDQLEWSVFFQEYLLENIQLKRKYNVLGNLGCAYHCKYAAGKEEYKEKAMATFELAIQEPDASSATKADYVVFLCNVQDWQRALDLIINITNSEDFDAGNSYDTDEAKVLHPDLQNLAQALGGQLDSVQARAHMHFLSLAYEEFARDEFPKEEKIKSFKETCEKTRQGPLSSYLVMNYALLGMAMEKLENVEDARAAYRTAKNNATEDKWKKWLKAKLKLCNEGTDSEDESQRQETKDDTQSASVEIPNVEVQNETKPSKEDFLLKGLDADEDKEEAGITQGIADDYDEEAALQEAIRQSKLDQKEGNQAASILAMPTNEEEDDDEEERIRKAIELSLQCMD